MPRLKKIQEFISLFYSERKVLTWLFEEVAECDQDDPTFRSLISQDKSRLKRLIESEFLINENGRIRINRIVVNWIGQFIKKTENLEIGQFEAVNNELRRLVKYYSLLEKPEAKITHLSQIKSTLDSLRDSLQLAIEALEDWLVLSQKDWDNQALFVEKVEDGKRVLDKISHIIKTQKKWMRDDPFFRSIEETSLIRSFLTYYDVLPSQQKFLNQLKTETDLLLAGDREASIFFNKITLLKKLSEKGQLTNQTNLKDLLQSETPTILNPLKIQTSTPNPSETTAKDIQQLYQKFKSESKKSLEETYQVEEELTIEKATNSGIDLAKIKAAFGKSKLDLFSFLKEYPRLSDLSFEERANLFFRLLSVYESEFKIEEKWIEEEGRRFAIVQKK